MSVRTTLVLAASCLATTLLLPAADAALQVAVDMPDGRIPVNGSKSLGVTVSVACSDDPAPPAASPFADVSVGFGHRDENVRVSGRPVVRVDRAPCLADPLGTVSATEAYDLAANPFAVGLETQALEVHALLNRSIGPALQATTQGEFVVEYRATFLAEVQSFVEVTAGHDAEVELAITNAGNADTVVRAEVVHQGGFTTDGPVVLRVARGETANHLLTIHTRNGFGLDDEQARMTIVFVATAAADSKLTSPPAERTFDIKATSFSSGGRDVGAPSTTLLATLALVLAAAPVAAGAFQNPRFNSFSGTDDRCWTVAPRERDWAGAARAIATAGESVARRGVATGRARSGPGGSRSLHQEAKQ